MQYLEAILSLEKFVHQFQPSDLSIKNHGKRQLDMWSYIVILVGWVCCGFLFCFGLFFIAVVYELVFKNQNLFKPLNT